MRWGGTKNGALLNLAAAQFDVLLTADQNLEHQQDVSKYSIGVVVLAARSNRMEHLRPLVPRALAAIDVVRAGQVVRVGV
jgi:hypothetical protein